MRHDTETFSFLAPKIWDILLKDIKDSESLDTFKSKIKKWIPSECPCRLCKKSTASRIYLSSENQRYISYKERKEKKIHKIQFSFFPEIKKKTKLKLS